MTELNAGDNSKEYKIEAIWDSMIYAKKLEICLPTLYYLITWKSYLKEKNTWELVSAIHHF